LVEKENGKRVSIETVKVKAAKSIRRPGYKVFKSYFKNGAP